MRSNHNVVEYAKLLDRKSWNQYVWEEESIEDDWREHYPRDPKIIGQNITLKLRKVVDSVPVDIFISTDIYFNETERWRNDPNRYEILEFTPLGLIAWVPSYGEDATEEYEIDDEMLHEIADEIMEPYLEYFMPDY